jgi:hypothetical protein
LVDSTLRSVDANVVMRRVRRRLAEVFEPVADVQFTHLTTVTESTVPLPVSLGLGAATATSSAALIAATTTLEGQVNTLLYLVNQLVYVLELNELSS